MPDASIRIEGLDKALRKIRSLEDLHGIKAAMKAAAMHIKGKIAKYPPESEANMPRTDAATGRVLPWYERGYGTRYPGGGGRKTSQTLGRKWAIGERDSGLTQIVGNNVSYGPFVQDKDRQAAFHKERGWKTVQDVASEESDTVVKFVKEEIDQILEKG